MLYIKEKKNFYKWSDEEKWLIQQVKLCSDYERNGQLLKPENTYSINAGLF